MNLLRSLHTLNLEITVEMCVLSVVVNLVEHYGYFIKWVYVSRILGLTLREIFGGLHNLMICFKIMMIFRALRRIMNIISHVTQKNEVGHSLCKRNDITKETLDWNPQGQKPKNT